MTPPSPSRRRPTRGRGYAARARPAAARGASLVGTEVELEVGPVAHGGFCVARHEGRVVFVRHTLPGEQVRARMTEGTEGDRFLRADAVEVLSAAEARVPSRCPHAGPGGCGGCDWQHVELAHQRELKAAVVTEQLRRLAGIERDVVVEPVAGDVDGLGWRTRVEFAVGAAGRAGLRPHRSHAVLPITACPIAADGVLATGVLAADWTGARAVDVAVSSTGQSAVVPIPPGTGPTLTESVRVGADTWRYSVAARGFWQVHPGAAATFTARLVDTLAPAPGERVLDLYAGVGLFALPIADAVGPTGSVLAVESDSAAADLARSNAGERAWVDVRAAAVEDALAELGAGRSVDLVVLDPPRSGAGRVVVEAIAALRPRAIGYVACDPAALARDLAYAATAGYALTELTAYDAFPMTHHVECIAILRPSDDGVASVGEDR